MNSQKAWIYCRVNNLRDAIGAMNPPFQQRKEFAEQKGFSVVGVSQDYGSGQKLDRPGLRAIRDAVCDGEVQILLVSSVSQIGQFLSGPSLCGQGGRTDEDTRAGTLAWIYTGANLILPFHRKKPLPGT